jgi:hypothetical protein
MLQSQVISEQTQSSHAIRGLLVYRGRLILTEAEIDEECDTHQPFRDAERRHKIPEELGAMGIAEEVDAEFAVRVHVVVQGDGDGV